MNDQPLKENRGQRHRRYDDTFKKNAVQLTLQGDRSIKQIAEALGISDGLLYTWRQQFAPPAQGAYTMKGEMTTEQKDAEIVRLRTENMRLREREIVLKKSLGILSETPESGMPGLRR
jgi:transposase